MARVFVGCNVENASYGLTICAERAAVCAAVAAGAQRFRRAVVVSRRRIRRPRRAAPAARCWRSSGSTLPVDGVGPAGAVSWTIAELLPAAFGTEQLA